MKNYYGRHIIFQKRKWSLISEDTMKWTVIVVVQQEGPITHDRYQPLVSLTFVMTRMLWSLDFLCFHLLVSHWKPPEFLKINLCPSLWTSIFRGLLDANYNTSDAFSHFPFPSANAPRITAHGHSTRWNLRVFF